MMREKMMIKTVDNDHCFAGGGYHRCFCILSFRHCWGKKWKFFAVLQQPASILPTNEIILSSHVVSTVCAAGYPFCNVLYRLMLPSQIGAICKV